MFCVEQSRYLGRALSAHSGYVTELTGQSTKALQEVNEHTARSCSSRS